MSDFIKLAMESFPLLLKGLGLTLELSIISLIIAMVIGLISCLFGLSRLWILRAISKVYVAIIRGTPLLVQAFFIYFGITQLCGFKMTAFAAGVISMSLNAGGYLSEIFRGGIQAVDDGQMEAARSLGLSKAKAMIKVVLPQAIRICIPSVVNQCCITIKDTSIICVIGLAELTWAGKQIIARTYQSFAVWIMVGIMYFIVIYALTIFARKLEKKVTLVEDRD